MKIVKYILIGLFVLLFLILLPGIIKPSLSWNQDLQIRRSIKTVYFAMINPMKMGDWIDGFKKVEAVNGFSSGAGSKYLIYLEVDNETIIIEEEITSFHWKEDLGLLFHIPQMEIGILVKFSTRNKQTHLNIETKVKGNNPFSRTALVFYQKKIKKQLEINFLSLKKMLEKTSHHHKT